MRINILSDKPRHSHNSILFPVYKWKSQLKKAGFDVTIFYSYDQLMASSADAAIILSRYFLKWQSVASRNSQNEEDTFKKVKALKNNNTRVFWFDVSDGSGSTDFDIIPHVDIFLKKQLLKNTKYYCENNGRKSVRIWLMDNSPEIKTGYDFYSPCPESELHKLRISWNLGMCDYRHFPSKFSALSNYYFSKQPYRSWDEPREYDTVFRGKLNYEATNIISFQRNRVLESLATLKGKLVTGGRVDRKQYLAELKNSKVCVSPFGWGEVCYRDFEAFLFGCLLVKPTLSYLNTFPNIFKENETYIPLQLDMTGTEEKVQYAIDHYNELKEIAKTGQLQYQKIITDPEPFISNFGKMLQ